MKENEFGKFLKIYRKENGYSLRETAEKTGISFSHLSKIERGEYKPSRKTIEIIGEKLSLDKNELLLIGGYNPYDVSSKDNIYNFAKNIDVGKVKESLETFAPTMIRIPVLGHISAGKPILATEHIEDYTAVPKQGNFNEDLLFMLKVKGDSMIGSRIYEGDKVLVKIQPEVENGEIAVVNVDGEEATIKRVKKLENGDTLLIASNDKYDPILIDDEKARVVGKVIQVIFEP